MLMQEEAWREAETVMRSVSQPVRRRGRVEHGGEWERPGSLEEESEGSGRGEGDGGSRESNISAYELESQNKITKSHKNMIRHFQSIQNNIKPMDME